MQNLQHVIGADLSKRTIDLFCHLSHSHLLIENNVRGYKQMMKWMKEQRINFSQAMIVMEHTGLYSFCFENFLHANQIVFSKVSALAVKRSMGALFEVNAIKSMPKDLLTMVLKKRLGYLLKQSPAKSFSAYSCYMLPGSDL